MTDNFNQELEGIEESSSSDDDSVSLLHEINSCQNGTGAKGMEGEEPDVQYVNKEKEKSLEIIRPKLLEGEMSRVTRSESAHSNVSTCMRIANKTLHKRNAKGETLLHKACRRKDVAQVKALIQAGISVNMEDHAGWTPLHEASTEGDKAAVDELLKAGANVNVRGFDGSTPLHDAVCSGHYQVVKLLLQYGSSASGRNLHGLTALDLAEKMIRDLLSSFSRLSGVCEQPREAQPGGQPGATSSEATFDTQLSCQTGLSPKFAHPSNVEFRRSDDKDRAKEPGDTSIATLRHSQAIEVVLKTMERNLREMSTWPLTNLQDAGRYDIALTQIQNVLTVVLTSQYLETDNIAQSYRSASSLQQRILKSQLVSLASRQRNLVGILQKQLDLVEAYVTMKNQLCNESSIHRNSTAVKQPSFQSYTSASTTLREACGSYQENHRLVRWTSPAPLLTQTKKTPTCTHSLEKKAGSCHGSTSQPGNTLLRHINFQIKGRNALIQTQYDDKSRHLSTLIQRGVMSSGSALQLLLKGVWHHALVTKDGSIKDRKGKLHLTPERWLESILRNNIPVSSAYAWDKVMFREKSLSHYLVNMEAEGNKAEITPEDGVEHRTHPSAKDTLATEGAALTCLMRVKIIHLVDDEELLPNAVLDNHWEKLLNKDYSELEDW